MPITVQNTIRRFRFDGVTLPDPGVHLDPEQVRQHYTAIYPDLVNATLRGPEQSANGVLQYEFTKSIGTKS